MSRAFIHFKKKEKEMTALRHAEIMRLCNELRDPTCALSRQQHTILQLLHAFDTYEALGRVEPVEPARAKLHHALAHMPRQCGKTFAQALFLTACALSAPFECAVGFLVESRKVADDVAALMRAFLEIDASNAVLHPRLHDNKSVDVIAFTDSDDRHKSITCYPCDNENDARVAASMYTMWLVDVGTTRQHATVENDAVLESAL